MTRGRGECEAKHLADGGQVVAGELAQELEKIGGDGGLVVVDDARDRLRPWRRSPGRGGEDDADEAARAEGADDASPGTDRAGEGGGDEVREASRDGDREGDVGEEGLTGAGRGHRCSR